MEIPSSALPQNLEYHLYLALMEKQIKRLGELARFLPFADQQEEMNRIVNALSAEATLLKSLAILLS
jgi:hypothetical protein